MCFIVELNTGITKVVDITTGNYVIPTVEGHSHDLAQGYIHLVDASGDIRFH
jgi:hypothetical protein